MRRVTKVFAAALLTALLCLPSLAAAATAPRLVDDAGLLTQTQRSRLEQTLDEVSARQGADVVIVTVESVGRKSPEVFADDYYDEHDYAPDGVLLLISMEGRDWHISTTGYGITAVTDAGIDDLSDRFLPYLSDGDYDVAFRRFAKRCDELFTMAKNGEPYDVGVRSRGAFPLARYLILSLVGGVIIALIAVSVMKGKLKTVRPQSAAGSYVRPGSMALTESRDLFLYTKVNRQAIPQNTNHSGGGSSTHVSSSGRTHGGGGGKF